MRINYVQHKYESFRCLHSTELTRSRHMARRLKDRGKAKTKSYSDRATVTNSLANVHVTKYESQFIQFILYYNFILYKTVQ